MTEQEYIDATNLAKVRAAKAVLRDYFAHGPSDEAHRLVKSALRALTEAEDTMALIVTCSPETQEVEHGPQSPLECERDQSGYCVKCSISEIPDKPHVDCDCMTCRPWTT